MGDTNIQWTDKTWNPVTGCTKVSLGCKNCYAERLFPRVYGKDTVLYHPNTMNPGTRPRKFTDVKLHPERLTHPLHWKKPKMIFVNSMSDLFHEDIPLGFISNVFEIMFQANQHTFQILTKRPQRMVHFFNHSPSISTRMENSKHIWLGISCENQATADERIPILLQVSAAVRFLSCEPLLDEIDIHEALRNVNSKVKVVLPDWIIVGGESGPRYRPMNLDWARDIRDQCSNAAIPFFFKQTAGKKEIPEDLQIREYPDQKKSGQASPE